MKKAYLLLFAGVFWLSACNDKVQVQPAAGIKAVVFPNPVMDRASIVVENQTGKPYQVSAFDVKGNLILQEQGSEQRSSFMLNLSGKPGGRYQVILEAGDEVITTHLLKL